MDNFISMLKKGANAGVLAGGFPYARNNWYVGGGSLPAPLYANKRVDTLSDLFSAASPGDIAFLGPGGYDEAGLIIPATLTNFTLIGAGNRGACFIEPSGANDEGLQVLADDCTLINIGCAKGTSGDYALNVKAAARFRAYGCKIEGDGVACLLNGTATDQTADLLMEDCEFAWCGTAIQMGSSGYGVVTTPKIKNCWFHNFTTAGLAPVSAGDWVVANLMLLDNHFDQQEDGTEPTDFILLSSNSNTGLISGNRFAIATNDTAKLTIGTGLMWVSNATEAGWSTARPA